MGKNVYYNTTDSGIVIDDEGHSVGGGDRIETEETDQISAALDAGTLIEVEEPEQDDSGDAKKKAPAKKA